MNMKHLFFIDGKQMPSEFHQSWLNLPSFQEYNGVMIHYKMGLSKGIFYDDKRCIIQFNRSGKVCTVSIYNDGGIIEPEYGNFSIGSKLFDSFDRFFNVATPVKIREQFPLLNKLIEHKTGVNSLEFYCFRDLGSSFSATRLEPLKGDSLSSSQMDTIIAMSDEVMKIENEYQRYKETRYYNMLLRIIRKQKKSDDYTVGVILLRLALMAFRTYSNFSDSDFDYSCLEDDDMYESFCDISEKDVQSQIDSNDEFVDFITSKDADISEDGASINIQDSGISELVSFTGNDNSEKIKSLESELAKANHDIQYYLREINNFTDKTSNTYRSNCQSALNRATQKAADIASRIQNLK